MVKRGDKVYLKTQCKDHGLQETLYCSSAAFFDRVMSFSLAKRTAPWPAPPALLLTRRPQRR